MLFLAPPAMAAERVVNAQEYETALLQASGHPYELGRWHGIWNYENGRTKEAIAQFERAAMHGDKLSQHLLSLMYWNGDDVERDPVQAYIWADLAAERGNSEDLIRVREYIWHELDEEQRARVVATGGSWYDRYGDAVAIERNNTQLRRFMRTLTGSRVGLLTSRLDINAARTGFAAYSAMGTQFYDDSRSRPGPYWKAQDLALDALMKQIGAGTVNVGQVRKAPEADEDE
jgi:hypothetical protein